MPRKALPFDIVKDLGHRMADNIPRILWQYGFYSVQAGAVTSLVFQQDTLFATVRSRSTHHVQINVYRFPRGAYCTCKHDLCTHMTAAFLELYRQYRPLDAFSLEELTRAAVPQEEPRSEARADRTAPQRGTGVTDISAKQRHAKSWIPAPDDDLDTWMRYFDHTFGRVISVSSLSWPGAVAVMLNTLNVAALAPARRWDAATQYMFRIAYIVHLVSKLTEMLDQPDTGNPIIDRRALEHAVRPIVSLLDPPSKGIRQALAQHPHVPALVTRMRDWLKAWHWASVFIFAALWDN
ncbi:MAG: hypothetical protein K6T83_17565, partial [Alicyclobacillus sp.]|nr:hypothetical protein [Alicyclobacillus sp.]